MIVLNCFSAPVKSIALFSLLILSCIVCRADDFKVKVHGQILFLDITDMKVKPMVGVKVEAWDSDVDGSEPSGVIDDYIASAITDVNGFYTIDGQGGDPGNYSWSKPDIYVLVVLTNADGKLRITDEFNNTQYFASDLHSHDNVEGDVNMQTLIVTGSDVVQANKSNKLSVWLGSKLAYDDYVSTIGPIPSGNYDVEYFWGWNTGTPWTNLNTTHWPNGYVTSGFTTSKHEFGHTIRHSLDGDQNHFVWDLTRFAYARYHDNCPSTNEGFAFNEGWAEFWSGLRGDNSSGNISSENECFVNFLLFQLSKKLPNHRNDMVEVLRQNPGSIHSFSEFCAATARLFPGNCSDIASLSSAEVITNGSKEGVLRWKIVQSDLAVMLKRQMSFSAELKQKLAAAKSKADIPKQCMNDSDCYKVYDALIKPYLIELRLAVNELMISSWKERMNDSLFFIKKIKEGNLEKWESNHRQAFRSAVIQTTLNELRKAYDACNRIGSKSKQVALLKKDLFDKMKRISQFANNGKPLPETFYTVMVGERLVKKG